MKTSFSLIALALLFVVPQDFVAGDQYAPLPGDWEEPPVESICLPKDASWIHTGVRCGGEYTGITCRFYSPDKDCSCNGVSWTCGSHQNTPTVPTAPPTMPPPTCNGTPKDCSGEVRIIYKDGNRALDKDSDEITTEEAEEFEEPEESEDSSASFANAAKPALRGTGSLRSNSLDEPEKQGSLRSNSRDKPEKQESLRSNSLDEHEKQGSLRSNSLDKPEH